MKKFFATVTANVFASTVTAASVNATEGFASELVRTALTEGKNYVVTGDPQVAADLQEMLMDKLNDMLNSAEEIGNTDVLDQLYENGHLAKDVYHWVVDTLEARKNPLSEIKLPTQEVIVPRNMNIHPDAVKTAMANMGLVIGNTCETPKHGTAVVRAFEVSAAGTIVYVQTTSNGVMPLIATALKGNAPVQTKQTKTNEEVSTMTNKSVSANQSAISGVRASLELAIDPAAKAVVEAAMNQETPAYELTAEQRAVAAEMKLSEDLAKFAEAQGKKEENASKVANSAEANALLGVLGAAGATKQQPQQQAPAQRPIGAPANPARNASAGSARQAAQNAGVNATQNTNQTNGGNVQMTNNTQTRGAQTQGTGNRTAAGAFGGQSVSANAGRNAAGAGLELSGAFAQGGFTFDTTDFELNEYVGRGAAGNTDFVWYLEAMKQYEQVMSAADFAANGKKNADLGITDVQFYSTDAVKALNNKRYFRDDEVMVMEVFFGATSYEFTFSYRESDRGAYIFSRNIARKQRENGNGYFCEYTSSRRSDKLSVVIDTEGNIREARKVWDKEAKAFVFHADDAPFVVEVGGESFVDQNLGWNVKIGQAPFVQIMILADSLLGLKKARDAKAQA